MSSERREIVEGIKLVPVYRAKDEATAQILRGLLEGEGIPAVLKSVQIPWYDGIMKVAEGYWGDLLVPESQAERAREILEAYEGV